MGHDAYTKLLSFRMSYGEEVIMLLKMPLEI